MAKNIKVCILSFSQIARDSRILREIELARQHFLVDVIGYGDWQPPAGVNFIQVPRNHRSLWFLVRYFSLLVLGRFFSRFYESAFWLKAEYAAANRLIAENHYDLIHANDWDALPVAVQGNQNKQTKVLFDAHEFSPEQESDKLVWRMSVKLYKTFLLKRNITKADKVITVSSGIAALYKKRFQIDCNLVMNARPYEKVAFKPAGEMINLVHHGFANPGRQLEKMIQMIPLLDPRYVLNLMLVGGQNERYLDKLKEFALKIAHGRVKFVDPVSPDAILLVINQFDLGIPFLSAPNLNILYSLPNKFFDFIMAGLGVVVPPLPSMVQVVNQYAIGQVAASQSPEDMAALLNSLTADDINRFKRNSLELAKTFNAENEMKKLLHIYQELLAE
jgi:glycosyltransferase involved in cell wall biosynthesis